MPREAVVVVDRAQMRAWSTPAREWLVDSASRGLTLMATSLPAAGRVMIAWRPEEVEGAIQQCSGALVSSRHVLTAAHCVCGVSDTAWYTGTAADCEADAKRVSVAVFFPTAGLFSVVGVPVIHEAYLSPQEERANPNATPVADLALLELDRDVPIEPLAIDEPSTEEHHIFASFGAFAYSTVPPGSAYEAKEEYKPGVKQLSVQGPILTAQGGCGEHASADTFCTVYIDLVATSGLPMDAGVCGGDSGAPLFALGPDGNFDLVGMASYATPRARICDSQGTRYNHFVRVSDYRDWILQATADGTPQDEPPATDCEEVIVRGPGNFRFAGFHSLLTMTSFATAAQDRPSMTVAGVHPERCRWSDVTFGVASCIPNEADPELRLGEGLAQIVACETSQVHIKEDG